MSKIKSLTELATAMNESGEFGYKLNAWEKGGKQRLYLPKTFGYNTKKMSTSAYIAILQDKAVACVYIECPSQTDNWITSQQNDCKESLQGYVDYIMENFEFGFTGESMEVILNNAILDAEPVKGYYTEWRQVRVAINNFGKLATRNRQFVVRFEGTKNTAPRNFVPLSDAGFEYLGKEQMLDAYEEVPDYDQRAIDFKIYKEKRAQLEQEALAAYQQAEEAKLALKQTQMTQIAQSIVAGSDILHAWKAAGCPHPAPTEVVEAKKASGLNWNNFTSSIE